jgi:hypothetical protein
MAPFTPSVDAIAFLGPEDLYDLTKSGDVPIAVPEEAEPGAEVESEVEVETDVETDSEMGSSRKFKRESMYTRIFEGDCLQSLKRKDCCSNVRSGQ